MTKDDVRAGARKKPAPFVFDGFTYLLKPMSYGAKRDLIAWRESQTGELTGARAMQLAAKLAALGLCGDGGEVLFTEDEVYDLDPPVVEAVAAEVAKRNGLDGRSADPKAE